MVRRQQAADRAVRPKLRSPGHPKFQRRVVVVFWEQIAKGVLPEQASETAGVAQAVGARWFHNAGGMPPFDLSFTPTGRYLSFAERRRSRCSGRRTRACVRSPGRSVAIQERSLESSGVTRPPWREAGVPGLGRSMEGRLGGPAPEGSEVGDEPAVTLLRTGPSVGTDHAAGRDSHPGAGGAEVHRPQQAVPQGPTVVSGVEPGADQPATQGRFPRG